MTIKIYPATTYLSSKIQQFITTLWSQLMTGSSKNWRGGGFTCWPLPQTTCMIRSPTIPYWMAYDPLFRYGAR